MTPILANRVADIRPFKMEALGPEIARWRTANPEKFFASHLIGDTLYRPARYARAAAIASLVDHPNDHKYSSLPETCGRLDLRKAIAADFARLGIAGLNPQTQICVTNGTMEAFAAAALAILNPGDEALIPEAYYFLYPGYVALAGGKKVILPTSAENGFKITPNLLRAYLTEKIRLMFLNTPGNPSGSVYTEEELRAIAEVLIPCENVFILCDEIYERFILSGKHTSLWTVAPELRSRILVFDHFSKPWGLSGLRLGWVGGPEEVMAAIKRIKCHMSWNTSTVAQAAALEALTNRAKEARAMAWLHAKLRAGSEVLGEWLERMHLEAPPAQGGMFRFPKVPDGLWIPNPGIVGFDEMSRGEQFAFALIPHGVTVAPGIDMGVPDHFRVLFAMPPEQIKIGMERIHQALQSF